MKCQKNNTKLITLPETLTKRLSEYVIMHLLIYIFTRHIYRKLYVRNYVKLVSGEVALLHHLPDVLALDLIKDRGPV